MGLRSLHRFSCELPEFIQRLGARRQAKRGLGGVALISRIVVFQLLAVFLLPGCRSLPEYVGPSSGDTAAIRFTTAGAKIGATIYSDAQCSKPAVVSANGVFVRVEAGRALTVHRGFSGIGLPYGMACGLTVSFVPEAGKRYEMEFIHGSPSCFMTLVELDQNGSPIKADREFIHPIFGTLGRWPVYLPIQKTTCPKVR